MRSIPMRTPQKKRAESEVLLRPPGVQHPLPRAYVANRSFFNLKRGASREIKWCSAPKARIGDDADEARLYFANVAMQDTCRTTRGNDSFMNSD